MLPKIDRYLATEELHPVVSKASQINRLAKLCADFLPPELAPLVRAANLRNGNLVVLAANASAAAKLKLLSPSLGAFLLKQGCEVNSVSVRVQPTLARRVTLKKQTVVGDAGLSALETLAERLGNSPLLAALQQFLRHQRQNAALKESSHSLKEQQTQNQEDQK
jgi:hypothetical protein